MTDEQLTGIDCSWFSDCIYFKQLCQLKLKVDGIKQENERLKAELQDIKEIAEENKNTAQYGGICKSILTLIKKAEVE